MPVTRLYLERGPAVNSTAAPLLPSWTSAAAVSFAEMRRGYNYVFRASPWTAVPSTARMTGYEPRAGDLSLLQRPRPPRARRDGRPARPLPAVRRSVRPPRNAARPATDTRP